MMGFTFVTDCASCSRLLSTSPRGNAVAGAFSAKRLNWLDEFSPHGFRVSESHLGSDFFFIKRGRNRRAKASHESIRSRLPATISRDLESPPSSGSSYAMGLHPTRHSRGRQCRIHTLQRSNHSRRKASNRDALDRASTTRPTRRAALFLWDLRRLRPSVFRGEWS